MGSKQMLFNNLESKFGNLQPAAHFLSLSHDSESIEQQPPGRIKSI